MSDLTARQRITAYLEQTGLSTARAEANVAAFEREIREQVAQQLYDQNPDRDADFSAGVDWAIDTIRSNQ